MISATALPVPPASTELLPATLTADGALSVGETILFAVVALIAVTCGLGLLTAKRAVSAAANMIGIMICLAVLYITSEAPFLGITQIVVYTGAVMTLVLFVIMMVGVGGEEPMAGTGPPAVPWAAAAWPPSCGAPSSRSRPTRAEGSSRIPPSPPLSPSCCSATTSSSWS